MSNLSLREAIEFMKKKPQSSVWLESGSCKIFTDGCNGHSVSYDINNTMFLFLKKSGLLKNNNYSGFKGYRTFDANISSEFSKIDELEVLYESYKKVIKKNLLKSKKDIELLLSQKYEKTSQKSLCEKAESIGIKDLYILSPRNFGCGKVMIGSRTMGFFDWKLKDILMTMKEEISRIDKVLETEDYSEYISISDYGRMPLSPAMEAKFAYISNPFSRAY